MSEVFTVVGADGFIGSALCIALASEGNKVQKWTRQNRPPVGTMLGHVIFAAGITADFRNRLLATAQTHVGLLGDVLHNESFTSLTYLSSARLYRLAKHTDEEAEFTVNPADTEQLYDLTKLTGESLCLNDARATVRVVRLSNVAGVDAYSPNFLPLIIRSALLEKTIFLKSAPESCKDYVMLGDVVAMLPRIALAGKKRLYNLASGVVTQAGSLADRIALLTGGNVSIDPRASPVVQPAIDITRINDEFGFQPTLLMAELEDIIHATKIALQGHDNH